MYDMAKMKALTKLNEVVPETFQAFRAFDRAALADGAVPAKYKELMAVAVALTTQCPYCIEAHVTKARRAGASDTELGETVMVAVALRAGAAFAHGAHCFTPA